MRFESQNMIKTRRKWAFINHFKWQHQHHYPAQGNGFDFLTCVQFCGIMLHNIKWELYWKWVQTLLTLSRNREIFLSSSNAWIAKKKKNFARVSFAMIIFNQHQSIAAKMCIEKREKVHSSAANENLQNSFLHVWLKWAELKYNLQLNIFRS